MAAPIEKRRMRSADDGPRKSSRGGCVSPAEQAFRCSERLSRKQPIVERQCRVVTCTTPLRLSPRESHDLMQSIVDKEPLILRGSLGPSDVVKTLGEWNAFVEVARRKYQTCITTKHL